MRANLIKEVLIGILEKTVRVSDITEFLTKDEQEVVCLTLQKMRKPYPGEDWKPESQTESKFRPAYQPVDGHDYHYSDTKGLRVYKHVLKLFAKNGESPNGHIDFDPKKNEFHVLSDKGRQYISNAAKQKMNYPAPVDDTPAKPAALAMAPTPKPTTSAPAVPASGPAVPSFGPKK